MNWKPNIIQRLVMLSGAIASFVGVVYSYTKLETWNALPKVADYKHPYGAYAGLIIFGTVLLLASFQRFTVKPPVALKVITLKTPHWLSILLVIWVPLSLCFMGIMISNYTQKIDKLDRLAFQASAVKAETESLKATIEALKATNEEKRRYISILEMLLAKSKQESEEWENSAHIKEGQLKFWRDFSYDLVNQVESVKGMYGMEDLQRRVKEWKKTNPPLSNSGKK